MGCATCGTALRGDDRFCLRCGSAAAVGATPTGGSFAPYIPADSWYHRIGDFLVRHFKAAVVVSVIAASVGLGALGVFDEKAVPEDRSSPGYQMVRALKSGGDIDTFNAVEPDGDWQSEYSLDDGDAHIRFSGSRMQIDTSEYDTDLRNAIDRVAQANGFTSTGAGS